LFSLFALSFVASPSVLWYCWLGLLTCKNRLPYNLYCVCGDVKHYTIQSKLTYKECQRMTLNCADLEHICSHDCVEDQDSEDDESFDEPEERVFDVNHALMINKPLLIRSTLLVVHHRHVHCVSHFFGYASWSYTFADTSHRQTWNGVYNIA